MSAMMQHMRRAALVAAVLAAGAATASAQAGTGNPAQRREYGMLAAQTGLDQVTLAWDQVPGATEYRIYLPGPDPAAPPSLSARPWASFSGSGRRAVVTGVQRLSAGAYLVAVAGRQVLFQGRFEAVTRAPSARVAAPAAVTARESGATEVTLSWDAVPGATAYRLGRAAGGEGLRVLCDLCPPEAAFVDTAATPGLEHLYTVQAIFPNGISGRTPSNPLTVGEARTAATAVAASPPPGQPAGSVATATRSAYPPPGQPAGTVPPATTPVAAIPASPASPAEQITAIAGRIQDNLTNLLGSVAAAGATSHAATPVSPGMASPAGTDMLAGLAGGIRESLAELLGNVAAAVSAGGMTAPASSGTMSPASDPLVALAVGIRDQVANLMGAVGAVSSSLSQAMSGAGTPASSTSPFAPLLDGIRNDVAALLGAVGAQSLAWPASTTGATVHASTPVGATTPTPAPPAPGGGPVASCRLDYQRADNMWAAFGRPDGQLGTETISLAPGQSRVFVTDWKYEKQRNDGTSFFGSHLRMATNRTGRPIRLQLRTTTLTGLVIFARTGSDTFWIRLDPNASRQFQADLMEVFCEN